MLASNPVASLNHISTDLGIQIRFHQISPRSSGFLGAVTVAALTHIQSVASKYPFSDYLKEEKLFDQFLFWPQFVLSIQIVHILFSTISAVSVLFINVPSTVLIIIAFNIGFTFYVVTKTWQLVELIRQLMWHSADYKKLYEENK